MLHGAPGAQLFDSLAVDGEGWVCVATIGNGGITAISPNGSTVEHLALPDALVTNICIVDDERRAFCTLSGTGQLVEIDWPPQKNSTSPDRPRREVRVVDLSGL